MSGRGGFSNLRPCEVPVRGVAIGEHFPQSDAVAPNVAGVREGAIVDGLWSVPEREGGREGEPQRRVGGGGGGRTDATWRREGGRRKSTDIIGSVGRWRIQENVSA